MHLVENLSITHIHGAEPSVESAVKGHTAGGGQHTAPILEPVIDCPLRISCDRIESNESSANIRRGGVHIQNSADEREPGLILHVEGLIIHAYVIGWNIEQVRRRIVRGWLLILIALGSRTYILHIDAGLGHFLWIDSRFAGSGVDTGSPIDRRVELMNREQLAIDSIENVGIAVAVEVRERGMILTLDGGIKQDVLVNAVVVPPVMRSHLKCPGRNAGIGIPRDDAH